MISLGSCETASPTSVWKEKTPLPNRGRSHRDNIDIIYERLWADNLRGRLGFFCRRPALETTERQRFTRFTNLPYGFGVDEKRMEDKLTFSPISKTPRWAPIWM